MNSPTSESGYRPISPAREKNGGRDPHVGGEAVGSERLTPGRATIGRAADALVRRANHQKRAVGEHHRREFLDSAPAVILEAAAVRTQRIRLTSAVTVLIAEDTVRAFQNFAMIDLLSRGRAEMIVGRGSSIEARC